MAKLALVVDTFPRWSERFVAREAAELRRRGVELSIFCLKSGLAADDPDWAALIGRRVVLPTCMVPRGFRSRDSEVNVRIEAVKRELGLGFLLKVACAASLRDLLRADGFRHVHAHFASLPSTLAWLAATAEKLPFSMSVHARDLFVEPQVLNEKLADAVRVFACHARAYEFLSGKTPNAVLMRHGLPLEQFPFAKRVPPKAGAPVRMLAAGRFVPKKGFDELVTALAAPALPEMNFVLTLLGDGPGRKKLLTQIKKLGLGERVTIKAPLCGTDLRREFDVADVFLAPYQQAPDGDADGVPNVILEAFALGLPVIGSDAGGLPEVLTARTGAVVRPGDTAALAGAIGSYLRAPEEALAKTAAARALIEDAYDIRKNILPLLELAGSG